MAINQNNREYFLEDDQEVIGQVNPLSTPQTARVQSADAQPSRTPAAPSRGIPDGGKVGPSPIDPFAGTYVSPVEGGYNIESPIGRDIYVPLLGETQAAQDVSKLVDEYRGLATQGLSSEEYQALRDRMQQESTGAYQTAMRNVMQQQAAQNIRGGAAAGQQARLAQQYATQQAQNAQDLMLKDIEYKDKMRGEYGKQLSTMLGISESDATRLLGGQVAGLGAETALFSSEQSAAAFEDFINAIQEEQTASNEDGDTTVRDAASQADPTWWDNFISSLNPINWF
jgi:hypothetical protein